mgnify:CR=1 FL=1
MSSHQELTVSWIASTAFAAVALAANAARFFLLPLFFERAAKSAALVSCCPFVALSHTCKEECERGAEVRFD